MNSVLPFERQMALGVGCLPLQQPPQLCLSCYKSAICLGSAFSQLPLQGIFMNVCRKKRNAYLCLTLFWAFPYLYTSAGSFIVPATHADIYLYISAYHGTYIFPAISGRIPHTHSTLSPSETSNSFGAQTCKLVLCHLRVLHSSIALALPCLLPYLPYSPGLNNVCDARSMRPLPKLAQCLSESISQACN